MKRSSPRTATVLGRRPRFTRRFALTATAFAALSVAGRSAQAAVYTYTATTTGTTDLWSAGTNWTPGAPQSATDTSLVFTVAAGTTGNRTFTTQNDQANPFLLNVLTLAGSGNATSGTTTYNITGSPLRFSLDGTTAPTINLTATNNVGTLSYNIASALVLDATTTFMGGGSAAFNFGGIISGAGGITMSGTGLVSINGANQYTGNTTLNAGTLRYTGSNRFGTGTVVLNGGILQANNGSTATTVANALSLTSSSTITNIGTGAITFTGPFTNSGGNNTLTSNIATGGLGNTFSGSAFNLSESGTVGRALTVVGSAPTTISAPINDFSGGVGTVGSSLTYAGSGILTLSGANTYTGGTSVTSGVLAFASAGAIGGTGANVSVVTPTNGTGATAAFNYNFSQADLARITTNSTGAVAVGAGITATNSLNFSAYPNLSLGGTGTAATPSVYSGVLTPANNTYRLGGGAAAGVLAISSTLADAATANSLVVGSSGTGTVTITNAANTYTGGTLVTSTIGSGIAGVGTLQTNLSTNGANGPFGSTAAAINLDNGTLGLGTATGTASPAATTAINVASGALNFTGQGTLRLVGTAAAPVTYTPTSLTQATGTDVLLVQPSTATSLGTTEIVTPGTAPTADATTGIVPYIVDRTNQAFVNVTNGSLTTAAFTNVTTSGAQNTTAPVNYTGTGALTGTVGALKILNNVNNGNNVAVTSGSLILTGTGGASFNGTYNFGSTRAYIGSLGTGTISYNAAFTGTGGATFYGTSAIVTTNGTNSVPITGGITIAGPFTLGGSAANQINLANDLTINRSGSVLISRAFNQSFFSLSGSGLYNGGAGLTGTLTLAGGGVTAANFSGNITGSALSLSKGGTYTQTLGGTNTYGGTTTVNGGGTLLFNGANTGTGAVAVSAANTTIGGTGSVAGAVTVNTGARITGATLGAAGAPTANDVGLLTLTTLTMASGSIYQADIVGLTNDRLTLSGALTISANTASTLTLNYSTPPTAALYTLASYASETGQFTVVNNLPAGYQLQYNATELNLVAVPEPSTLIGFLLVGALVWRGCRTNRRTV